MAFYIQGYNEERFVTTVNQNFLCLICFNVLRDPVMCSRNQHCFCRSCITQHLQNLQRCPTCNDELTVQTLAEPQKMIKDLINELNIHCVYNNRGCQEIVQLQHLDRHENNCGFTPVVCTNEGCGAIVNKQDLIHHESEQCEYRKLKCHSCGEMTITLANMEERIANTETNIVSEDRKIENLENNMETKIEGNSVAIKRKVENLEKNMKTNIEENSVAIKRKIENLEKKTETSVDRNITDMKTEIEAKFGAVNNEVKRLKAVLVDSFDEVKDVLVKMEDRMKENTRKIRNTPAPLPCGDKDKICVARGVGTDSVEIFNWSQQSWARLRPFPEEHGGGTAFVHNHHVVIAGGTIMILTFLTI